MFTLKSIQEAHSKVKSGADFPLYIQDIKKLGVCSYEVFVSDGSTKYYGMNDFTLESEAKYSKLEVSKIPNTEQFLMDIKAHQEGKTDYPTFCTDCAKSGIDKWVMDLEAMTCSYYDTEGNEILIEKIPS